MCACECSAASVLSDSLWPCGLYSVSLLSPWNSPGRNTGVGCLSLLQGIFPTQGSESLALQADFLPTEPPGMSRFEKAGYHVIAATGHSEKGKAVGMIQISVVVGKGRDAQAEPRGLWDSKNTSVIPWWWVHVIEHLFRLTPGVLLHTRLQSGVDTDMHWETEKFMWLALL